MSAFWYRVLGVWCWIIQRLTFEVSKSSLGFRPVRDKIDRDERRDCARVGPRAPCTVPDVVGHPLTLNLAPRKWNESETCLMNIWCLWVSFFTFGLVSMFSSEGSFLILLLSFSNFWDSNFRFSESTLSIVKIWSQNLNSGSKKFYESLGVK